MILQNKIINKNTQQQVNNISLQSIVGNVDIEYVKVQEQVKNQRQQHYG